MRSVPKQCVLTVSLHCVGKKRKKKETKRKTKKNTDRPPQARGGSAEALRRPAEAQREKQEKKRKRKKKSIDRWPWARGGSTEGRGGPTKACTKFLRRKDATFSFLFFFFSFAFSLFFFRFSFLSQKDPEGSRHFAPQLIPCPCGFQP